MTTTYGSSLYFLKLLKVNTANIPIKYDNEKGYYSDNFSYRFPLYSNYFIVINNKTTDEILIPYKDDVIYNTINIPMYFLFYTLSLSDILLYVNNGKMNIPYQYNITRSNIILRLACITDYIEIPDYKNLIRFLLEIRLTNKEKFKKVITKELVGNYLNKDINVCKSIEVVSGDNKISEMNEKKLNDLTDAIIILIKQNVLLGRGMKLKGKKLKGKSVYYYHNPEDLKHRLELVVGSLGANNGSKEIINDGYEIIDTLLKIGDMDKATHKKYFNFFSKFLETIK